MPDERGHPGKFIKTEVIPPGVSVTAAAEMMGVGRPALSNLLNGKAALSQEMALRLEKAFGVDRDLLLDKQMAYDEDQNRHLEKKIAVKAYAPSFLDISAEQIEAWADKLEARAQLPALLRRLVTTTGTNLLKVDFPAYDNAQRHGWDGQVETDTATPWIPAGPSGWEFGCNQDPKKKADEDYAARVRSVPSAERKNLTFVFVTPRNWAGKEAWAKRKATDGHWKDVKALDASDVEQWLEQSVPAQAWLAEKLGIKSDDALSLEECWDRWALVTEPQLSKQLFAGAVETHNKTLADWLNNSPQRPFIVTSDSEEESLAYLACALDAAGVGDKTVVLRSTRALGRATKSSSNFIAVLVSGEVESASAGLHRSQHTVIVRRRNGVEGEPDVALDLADDTTFNKGLLDMSVPEEDVSVLSRASGQSLTILRRRLSVVPEIRTPPWAEDNALSRKLIALGFAGAWDSQSKEDQEILSCLAGDEYETIEKSVAELLNIEHSPVWAVGRHRGVASKLDVLYAIRRLVTRNDLETFFLTARIVLSERDPALDLPEDKQRWAGLYGKARNHSAALRDGMCEMLVLLAIHGNNLFRDRGFDVEAQVKAIVRDMLTPFAAETWASQKGDLVLYAEGAPDVFLEILEQDLQSDDPKVLSLLKPASTEFFGGGCPRSGLLWALELLAWKPERLPRVASLLARMSAVKIDDNWVNKPESSLKSIFRCWMPQTAAPVEERCAVLENITRRYPEVGWRLCVDQFASTSTVGSYAHRPRWRKDAAGAGQLVTRGEAYTFGRKALDLAIDWPAHDEQTLGDLVEHIQGLDEADQGRIWDRIRAWIASGPSDDQKAALRERVRLSSFTRRARRAGRPAASPDHAREIYEKLEATDPLARHRWLFLRQWVEESWDEVEAQDFDYQKREKKIEALRARAIEEVWRTLRYKGIAKLCEAGEAAHLVGWQLARAKLGDLDSFELATRLIVDERAEFSPQLNRCFSGYLFALDDAERNDLLTKLIERFKADEANGDDRIVRMLKLAPFKRSTWQIADGLPEEPRTKYFAEAMPGMMLVDDAGELRELVDRLLAAKRPTAALAAARFQTEKLDSPLIVRLLRDLATTPAEQDSNIRFQSHELSRAFEVLDNRADVSADDLAHLEFLYLSALQHEKRGIPNLQRQLAQTPTLFAQAVGLVYKRQDAGDDPPEWHIEGEKARSSIATQAYTLLHQAKHIPGTGDDGKIDVAKLKEWIKDARALCKSYGRELVGDNCIGELLSKSGRDEDGIWPAIPVRNALEEIGNPTIADAMAVGLYNQRGAHFRERGGKQERELAAMYRDWAKSTAVDWPFTSRLLEKIAQGYERDAEYHDTDANLRKRLHD